MSSSTDPAGAGRLRPVELRHAARLINHGPTILVTSAAGGRRDIMAAAWSMPVEFDPPRVAVVIDKKTLTRELASASGGFAICVPGTALIDLTHAVGSVSGRDVDKFAAHGLVPRPGPVLGMPVLEAMLSGCPVVTADIPVLRETGGKAALYADPANPADFAVVIEKALGVFPYSKQAMQDNVARFSWDKNIDTLMQQADTLLSGK